MERPCQHTYTGYSRQPCFALSPFLRSLARGMWRGTAPLLPRALCWCDSSKGLCWQHHLPLEAQTKDAAVGPGCLSVLGEEGLPASRPLTSCQLICSSKEVKLQPCGVCSSRDSPSEQRDASTGDGVCSQSRALPTRCIQKGNCLFISTNLGKPTARR